MGDHDPMEASANREAASPGGLVELSTASPIWDRVFTVAPLVLIGTKEGASYDLAPKHLALPLGWENYFGFVCTPAHATYSNALAHGAFTVSFPRASQILETGLAAGGRLEDSRKPSLRAVRTFPARSVDGVLVEGCALYLECRLDRVVDGFGANSLIVGRVVAAAAPAEVLRGPDVDDARLLYESAPLVYLAPGRFGAIRETWSVPVPADFKR